MVDDFFTTQMFYLLLFNIFDAIFRMTSEKIMFEKINPYLKDCAIFYLKSQFILDMLIITSLYLIIFKFRIDIVVHILDINLEDKIEGNDSFETDGT